MSKLIAMLTSGLDSTNKYASNVQQGRAYQSSTSQVSQSGGVQTLEFSRLRSETSEGMLYLP
jgi:hypothetical protein